MPRGLRKDGVVKAESGKPAPMSETESSLSRFTANAAGVQSHEVGLKVKTESAEEVVPVWDASVTVGAGFARPQTAEKRCMPCPCCGYRTPSAMLLLVPLCERGTVFPANES